MFMKNQSQFKLHCFMDEERVKKRGKHTAYLPPQLLFNFFGQIQSPFHQKHKFYVMYFKGTPSLDTKSDFALELFIS